MSEQQTQDLSGVTLLGNQHTKYLTEYDPTILEKFQLQFDNSSEEQVINIDFFEWVGKCPKTGQPDMGAFHISYIPGPERYAVETKSLKLYMYSFQRHGAFHEQVTHTIMQDLVDLLHPVYLSVFGDFHSRGGCCILPISIYADDNHQDLKRQMQLACMTQALTHRPRTS